MRTIQEGEAFFTPWTPEDIAEACEVTADLLEGHWTKGAWFRYADEGVTYCVEGALAAALGIDVQHMAEGAPARDVLAACPVYDAVMTTVRQREDRYFSDLMQWNDTYVNQEHEVLDVLHATAKRVLGVPRDDA